jgi:dTDP-4-dehydrorhamnose reductase
MQKKRVLVFGRIGQVGWELRHKLACQGQVIVVDYPEIDFLKPESIRQAVHAAEPSVIVNAAAYTAVDKAEADAERAMAINGHAPGVLAEEARRLGILLVHYSTDYVFDGTKPEPYVETDIPNPQNEYGRTKLAGDMAVQSAGCDYLILRTSWVYGARGANFLLTMLRLAKERPELRIVDDQTGSPTTSECIAQATAQILAQVLAPGAGGGGNRLGGRSGVYHLTSAGATTWFGFAKAFLSRLGNACPTLTPIPSSEYPVPARRPVNSVLSCAKLAETFGVHMPDWEHALDLVLETLHESTPKP